MEVNSVLRSEIRWSKYKKVPIVVCDGDDKVTFLVSTVKGIEVVLRSGGGKGQSLRPCDEPNDGLKFI